MRVEETSLLETDNMSRVATGFDKVREAFEENFSRGLELGASFVVMQGEKVLVNLYAGHADSARTNLLGSDALFAIWSASKGVSAICLAVLVERGKLDYEERVAVYWPEFAKNGKGDVTVAQLLSHQAGLVGVRTDISMQDYYNHTDLAGLLAEEEPFFEPGSAWGYHALSFGILADELVRRTQGCTLAEFLRTEVTAPLGLGIFAGLPEAERDRAVETVPPAGDQPYNLADIPNEAAFNAAVLNPPLLPELANDFAWQRAGIPAAGMMATAESLARLYALIANGGELGGVRLLSAATIAAASRMRTEGPDQVTGLFRRLSSGFQLNSSAKLGPGPAAFGHAGWGGTVAFADQEKNIGVAYACNAMRTENESGQDDRFINLARATYDCLG